MLPNMERHRSFHLGLPSGSVSAEPQSAGFLMLEHRPHNRMEIVSVCREPQCLSTPPFSAFWMNFPPNQNMSPKPLEKSEAWTAHSIAKLLVWYIVENHAFQIHKCPMLTPYRSSPGNWYNQCPHFIGKVLQVPEVAYLGLPAILPGSSNWILHFHYLRGWWWWGGVSQESWNWSFITCNIVIKAELYFRVHWRPKRKWFRWLTSQLCWVP